MAAPFKRVQWGTQIEVKEASKAPTPAEAPKLAPVNFSMLYLGQRAELAETEIPDRLVVCYSRDYNILEVDLIIKKRFESRKKRLIDQFMVQIKTEELKLSRPQSLVDRKASLANKERIQRELQRVQTDEDREKYLLQSYQLVEAYRKLGVRKRIVDFTGKTRIEVSDDSDETDEYREELISRYLEVARRYIEIDVIRETDADDRVCFGCGLPLEEIPMDEVGLQRCPHCGLERVILMRNVISHEHDEGSSRSNYDDRETFYRRLLRFQGKQSNKLPLPHLFEALDRYFLRLGLPGGEQVRALPHLADGTKPGTSCAMMIKALQEEGFADCYDDRNLVMHLYWGWNLPDISHLEERIMQDYDSTQKVFERLKKGKKSSINGEFRQFKHLELVGYPCNESMFRIIKTRDTLERTEETWRQMCEGAGLPFIPTI